MQSRDKNTLTVCCQKDKWDLCCLIFRSWELILLIWSQPPGEKNEICPNHVLRYSWSCLSNWDSSACPCCLAKWKTTHRRRGWWENLPVFWSSPEGHTSGSIGLQSCRRAASTSVMRNKGTKGKVKQKKAPGKDVFMFTYYMEKKEPKVYSMKINVSRKFILMNLFKGVIIQELPNGSHKIRVGVGKGPTRERKWLCGISSLVLDHWELKLFQQVIHINRCHTEIWL